MESMPILYEVLIGMYPVPSFSSPSIQYYLIFCSASYNSSWKLLRAKCGYGSIFSTCKNKWIWSKHATITLPVAIAGTAIPHKYTISHRIQCIFTYIWHQLSKHTRILKFEQTHFSRIHRSCQHHWIRPPAAVALSLKVCVEDEMHWMGAPEVAFQMVSNDLTCI